MAVDFEANDLMPLEVPNLRVSRPVAACSRCRNAKIKCDGKLPACTSCEKNGRAAECSSSNDQFSRGKERSYVSTLETRIDRLQARLEEARARKPSVVEFDEDTSMSRRPSRHVPESHTPATPITNRAQRRKEATAIDDLVSDFGFLSVNATARDFYGFTTAMSYSRLILWACCKDPLPAGLTQPLPPRHAANMLIQHYLTNVFDLLPVFDEASFFASFDTVYSKNNRQVEPQDLWNVRIVLAISSASVSEQRGDQRYLEAIGHICAALEQSEAVLHPGAIASVQALVLLTQYAMLDPHHFDSWGLIGAASRAMVDLGLHQDPPTGSPMQKGKLELRRRVYYCVYALDRSTSLVQTRAFSFSDDSAKVKIPFTRSSSSAPTTPQPTQQQNVWLQSTDRALDLATLRQIQSRWYHDLFQSGRTRWDDPYPYIWNICDEMRKWFEDLPTSISPNMHAFFELDLLYSYVYVLSPSPRVPIIDPFAQKLIFEYCIRYAESMVRLISDPSYSAPLTFYDAMRVYMTGRQFLDVLQHNTDGLLDGHVPSHPKVKPSTAPAPPMPVVALPPGDTVLHFNVVRSITCIKQITECLSRFGIRWGYMSWKQRYQSETASMLEDLNTRLREMGGPRRPSMWLHHDSTGSIGSSTQGGSMSYPSNRSDYSSMPSTYQQPHISMQHTPTSSNAGLAQISPPAYQQQQADYGMPQTGYPMPQYQPDQQRQHFQQHPIYDFGQPPVPMQNHQYPPQAPTHGRPSVQFANWTGYHAQGGHPDTLDDENAVGVQRQWTGDHENPRPVTTSIGMTGQTMSLPQPSRAMLPPPTAQLPPPDPAIISFQPPLQPPASTTPMPSLAMQHLLPHPAAAELLPNPHSNPASQPEVEPQPEPGPSAAHLPIVPELGEHQRRLYLEFLSQRPDLRDEEMAMGMERDGGNGGGNGGGKDGGKAGGKGKGKGRKVLKPRVERRSWTMKDAAESFEGCEGD
ncbi:unnamed protein product [Zymoseptoria tritici ST99CH_1A5]|uniref:Zn(2)-C6 fungal-type domain-containing protein n=1 Tax=Zymoseptoria tritici ST99CH_1A5 TaxID=1276529 RepID=A0A1Y6L815_ZYMTR|nr:unnamed protein product [Zymoseptoria tritici ST99CH_1A5]